MSVTLLTRHPASSLSCQTIKSLAALVATAQERLDKRKLNLADVREQLQHLDAQIGEFIRDTSSQPPRDAGIFLCQMAVHLRGLASELDGVVS